MLSFQACERAAANLQGECPSSSVNNRRRTWLDAVNYKVALVITLLFSVAMVVGISA